MFGGRKVMVATMHCKENVIAPILEKELGVICQVTKHINTDILGTFSGEVERKDDPITTLRNKCHLAHQNTDYDLIIANEGSFGPHPNLFFIPADEEIMMLKDYKNDIEIIESHTSTETNFRGASIKTLQELEDFIDQVKFPEHGVIIRSSKKDFNNIVKGIIQYDALIKIFEEYVEKYGVVYIETDMRALYNPSRMKVISELTEKLIEKIKSICPKCQFPGFARTHATRGLLCCQCHRPTHSIISFTYKCQKCNYEKIEMYPFKPFEDPMYCNFCNP